MKKTIFTFLFLTLFSLQTQAFESDCVECVIAPMTGPEFSKKNLEALLNIARINEDMQFINMVKRKLGVSSDNELLKFIEYCKEEEKEEEVLTITNGEYHPPIFHYRFKLKYTDTPEWNDNKTIQKKEAAFSYFESVDSTHFKIVFVNEPKICLRKDRRLIDAYSTFIHELVHLYKDDYKGRFLSTNLLTKEQYAENELMRADGEFEAFKKKAEAIIKLQENFPQVDSSHSIIRYFDADGALVDKKGFKEFIMEDLGYKDRFDTYYPKYLQNTLDLLNQQQAIINVDLQKLPHELSRSEENIKIMNRNIKSANWNIPIYKRRSNHEKVKEWEEILFNSNQNVEFYKQRIRKIPEIKTALEKKQQFFESQITKINRLIATNSHDSQYEYVVEKRQGPPSSTPKISVPRQTTNKGIEKKNPTLSNEDVKGGQQALSQDDNIHSPNKAVPHPTLIGVFTCENDNSKMGDVFLNCN